MEVHLENVPENMQSQVSVDGYFSPRGRYSFSFTDKKTGSVEECFSDDNTAEFCVWVKSRGRV